MSHMTAVARQISGRRLCLAAWALFMMLFKRSNAGMRLSFF
jgi:hypothetical protein